MADFKISGKNVITQAGTAEPVLASNVTLGTGIIKAANITAAASSTLSCTTDSTTTVATADSSSLSIGMAVSGTNIPANAHIVTIPNATSFTITSAATGGATSTLTFNTGITSAKIEDNAVTTAKIPDAGVTAVKVASDVATTAGSQTLTNKTLTSIKQTDAQNLSGTYSSHEMIMGKTFTLTGDVTVNENLVLGNLSGTGNDIIIQDDGTARTITSSGGTGILEVGELLVGKPLIPSTDLPAGTVIQVVSFLTNDRGSVTTQLQQDTALNPSIEKTIIPKGTGSSFLIKIRWIGEAQDFHGVHANIHRNGARINATNPTTTPDFDFHLANMVQAYHGSDYDSTLEYLNFETFDKTGSTALSPITFKLVMSSGSNKTVWTNRCEDRDSYAGGTSEIIIMEIAG